MPPDELPEHLRPSPKMDLTNVCKNFNLYSTIFMCSLNEFPYFQVDMNDPEQLLKLSKKGKTLMMFVHTAEGTPRHETEEITKLWQTGLWNSHIQAERY